jgi:hypothetical protein
MSYFLRRKSIFSDLRSFISANPLDRSANLTQIIQVRNLRICDLWNLFANHPPTIANLKPHLESAQLQQLLFHLQQKEREERLNADVCNHLQVRYGTLQYSVNHHTLVGTGYLGTGTVCSLLGLQQRNRLLDYNVCFNQMQKLYVSSLLWTLLSLPMVKAASSFILFFLPCIANNRYR